MQCACGKTAQVRLDYNATDLCAECFCKLFEDRVRKANKEFKMLRRGDVIAVGVSGGKDSAAMLFVLKKLADEIGGITLKPILIDEGIAGYRDEAAKKAVQLCERLGLTLQTRSYAELYGRSMDAVIATRGEKRGRDTSAEKQSCTYCGVFRKQALNKAAREMACNKLATGHNADDIGQTLLINLLRGETDRANGADSGEAPQGYVQRIKPLAYNLERECALYCLLQELPFYRGDCPYAEEAFRGRVKSFLNDAENERPGVKFSLLKSALSLPGGRKKGEKKSCTECGEPCNNRVCRACQLKKELGA